MRKFLATLSLIIAFSSVGFAKVASTTKDKELKVENARKMAQLKQLLEKATRGSEATSKELPSKPEEITAVLLEASKPGSIANIVSAKTDTSSVGVISAPFAVAQSENAKQTTATGKNNTNNTTDGSQQLNLYDQAFSGVVNQLLPMTPEQVAKLRDVFTESQLAAATPPGIPPKPTSSSLLVNLSPQAIAPVIRLGAGYITSVVFVDATGQPWPIAAYSVGDPTAFNIQWDRKGSTMLIQAATFYKRSNMAVILRDLNTPVMLTLISGQEAVDYRVDLRIPGVGPNAIFAQNGIPDAVNPVLFDVLNGIPPKGSKQIRVRGGGNNQAWLLNKKLYLRTNLNIVSPGWQATMSSVDGTHAYQLQPSPVILALQNGRDKAITLTIEGLE